MANNGDKIAVLDICYGHCRLFVVILVLREDQNSSGAVFSLSAPSPPDRCRHLRRGGGMLASSPSISAIRPLLTLEGSLFSDGLALAALVAWKNQPIHNGVTHA